MYLKLFMLSVTILGLTNCTESDGQTLYANRRNGGAEAAATGTGSGGGGYDDNAKIGVDLTKEFLSQMIANSDEVIFEQFPDGFKKENLIQIIKDISYSGDERTRDGERLLFDYDFGTKKVFYTKQFVDKYGQYKFTNSPEDDLKNINEFAILILHEMSHLMGIGQSKAKDPISSLFSISLLNFMLSETHICEGSLGSEKFSIVVNPQTGMSYFVENKSPNDFRGGLGHEIDNGAFSEKVWRLGDSFPFFTLTGDEASGAHQIAIAKVKLELGVQSYSPYDLIDYLLGRDLQPINLMFWNFENNSAEYNYKMVYNSLNTLTPNGTEVSTATAADQPSDSTEQPNPTTPVKIEEIGLISFIKDSELLSESEILIDVKLDGQTDPDQSFNIPLNCQKFVSALDLDLIMDLNAENEEDANALETKLNKTSEIMHINKILEINGCNEENSDIPGLQSFCESRQLIIDHHKE